MEFLGLIIVMCGGAWGAVIGFIMMAKNEPLSGKNLAIAAIPSILLMMVGIIIALPR